MHWIPDVPQNVKTQIERENFITQKAIWKTKQLLPTELIKIRNASDIFLENLNLTVNRSGIDEIVEENLTENRNLLDK